MASSLAALLLGAGVATVATVATAYPGGPVSDLKLPYQAELVDAGGDPLDGNYDVVVRELADADPASTVLWEESFPGESVVDGRLSLIIGTGNAIHGHLDGDVLADHPDASVDLSLDGESMGAPALVGAVPRAVHADVVPADGLLWGGNFGLVPAEAVEPGVEAYAATYESGGFIPEVAGWHCVHTPTLVNPALGLTADPDDMHAHDMWFAHVGPDSVPLRDGLSYTPSPNVAANMIRVVHASTECAIFPSPNCNWTFEEDTSARARVTSICAAP